MSINTYFHHSMYLLISRKAIPLLAAITTFTVYSPSATATPIGIDTTKPTLPPYGQYVSPTDYHTAYENGIVLDDVSHYGFSPHYSIPPETGTEHFISTVAGTITFPTNPDLPIPFIGCAEVTVEVTRTSSGNGPTGTFRTEMIQLDLGSGRVRIREDPAKSSNGMTIITQPESGSYHIDSFFDVFTEISIDGGAWIPSNEATRVNLMPGSGPAHQCPEAGTTIPILITGVLFLGIIRNNFVSGDSIC